MPGIPQISSGTSSVENKDTFHNVLTRNGNAAFQSSNGLSVTANGFWSRKSDNVSYDRLQKFWCELTPQARRNLLKIDKHAIFEHARKNMYCSRCNGLLLESFLQIVMYGKSQQPNPAGGPCISGSNENHTIHNVFGTYNDVQDPATHPWGGLTTTRDGMLTLLECYFYSKSLRDLQNLFDSARARERERELLYPDACGGGARGWISQGSGGYGRGHGARESCALHTAKLSVETLVDFWSALGEETHQSLLKMKEEDFIERLMYRFDSKRFCRDCRKNVIREFKELKELERLRRETRCTSWFCVADTVFDYEVSLDTIQVNWHQAFSDAFGKYHHFEWAVGTGEGKSDILEFENVGLKRSVQANGLDLSGFNSCHITVRAWKVDGRCDELCAKAHALQGQQCVHCRLVVGGGFVSITKGESITRFFEHAEEAEEEEDDDFMDKDGNELDGECFRPQKHAKSPELAREFLLDAATIIFKEQVEKAFREGTARQNAHSILICLALKLLEERAHIACKEIITFEKQMKLLEEEEKEKREKEERREQRRTKEREKKLRRKERLRGREIREKNSAVLDPNSVETDDLKDESKECFDETVDAAGGDFSHETDEVTRKPSLKNESSDYNGSNGENTSENNPEEEENGDLRGWSESFQFDDVKYSCTKQNTYRNSSQDLNVKATYRRKDGSSETKAFFTKYESRYHVDDAERTRSDNDSNKDARGIAPKPYIRISGKCENFQYMNRSGNRYDSQSCSCSHLRGDRPRADHTARPVHDPKRANRYDTQSDLSKPYYQGSKYPSEFRHENSGQGKGKVMTGNMFNAKKVWEPLDSRKKYTCNHPDSDVTLRSAPKVKASESSSTSSDDVADISVRTGHLDDEMKHLTEPKPKNSTNVGIDHEDFPKDKLSGNAISCPMTGSIHGVSSDMSTGGSKSDNSDNFSSCLSEGDSSTLSSPQNMEPESISDSEDSGQNLDTETSECCVENGSSASGVGQGLERQVPSNLLCNPLDKSTFLNGREDTRVLYQAPTVLPQMQNNSMGLPVYHPPSMDFCHQGPGSWSSYGSNGLQPFPISAPYMFPPSSYGYGLNGNPQFMMYRPLQHLTPAVFNHPHIPIFQPVSSQVTDIIPSAHYPSEKATSNNSPQMIEDTTRNGKEKAEVDNNGFSLFHFGGPVTVPTGTKTDPTGKAEVQEGNSSVDLVADCHSCSEEDYQKQEKLFDSINGIRFSIF